MNAMFGDGDRFSESDLDPIRESFEQEAITFRWNASDVLILDNMQVAHGRKALSGPRKILVVMGDPYSLVRSTLAGRTSQNYFSISNYNSPKVC